LVATTDIAPGVRLNESNTRFEQWPAEIVPEGAVTDPSQIDDHSLRIAAVTSDVILTAKLNKKGQHGASQEIPAGMRIITVPVNLTKTHSGLIMPGDRVDVIVTFKQLQGGRRNVTRTKTLLEYIKVFAADSIRQSAANSSDSSEYDAKNISLLVDPNQYNMCVQAQQMGTLSLALRRKDDDAVAEASAFDEEMLGNAATSFAHEEEMEQPSPNSNDIDKFLNEQGEKPEGQAQAAVQAEPVPAQMRPQWTVKIFAGQEVREQQVDLVPVAEETPTAAPGAVNDGKKTEKTNWLKSLFSGA
jgi:pilus assembly protein CpaB